jgi:hypothetical protein
MSTKKINVANDFSKYPAGRYEEDGDFSAQSFREKLLVEKITIELDGVAGYSSSFLEEAFGGLVRDKKIKKEILTQELEFISADENLIAEIRQYINEA